MNSQKKVILLLIILEIIFAAMLFYSSNSEKSICLPGFNCEEVQNSIYGSIFGIKLSTLGIIAFPALLIVFLLSVKNKKAEYLFIASTILGAIASLAFLYIQFFILKKVCSSCLAIDVLMVIICIFGIYDFRKSHEFPQE